MRSKAFQANKCEKHFQDPAQAVKAVSELMFEVHAIENKRDYMILEAGRICLKFAGREAGKYCVVLEPGESFVLVTGPKTITGVKRRKCNIFHLEPTEHMLDIGKSSDDAHVEGAWNKSGLIEKLKIQLPVKKQRRVKE